MFKYRYVGFVPADFPSLAGELAHNQGREHGGRLEPGDVIEIPEPVVHHDLAPANAATREATEKLHGELEGELEDFVGHDVDEPEPVKVRRPRPRKPKATKLGVIVQGPQKVELDAGEKVEPLEQ